jgi:hypothetical protein
MQRSFLTVFFSLACAIDHLSRYRSHAIPT